MPSLGGCFSIAAPIAIAGMETASYVNTEKFLTDHIASAVTDEDCSAGNFEKSGGYCADADEVSPVASTHYCYRTLGSISCYTTPDPFGDGAQLVE